MNAPFSYQKFKKMFSISAESYLDYLDKTFNSGAISSGHKVIHVLEIHVGSVPLEYILITGEKVLSSDSIEVWVKNRRAQGISIIEVGRLDNHLFYTRILDTQNVLASDQKISPDDVCFVSDLRYLIRSLNEFYSSNIFSFKGALPSLESEIVVPDSFSSEQREAVDAVFHSCISYVSGAPGTGKTKAVLAQCVLHYIRDNKRVWLLAPTNNAVEQMLRGVLPVLEASGIPLEKVFRLGTSSEIFAAQYPEVIGDTAKQYLLDSLIDQRKYYTTILGKIAELQESSRILFAKYQAFIHANERIIPQLRSYRSLSATYSNLHQKQKETDILLAELSMQKDSAVIATESAYANVQSCQRIIVEHNRFVQKVANRYLHRKRYNQLRSELEQLLYQLPIFQKQYDQCVATEKTICKSFTDAGTALDNIIHSMDQVSDKISKISREILIAADFDSEYLSAVEKLLDDVFLSEHLLISMLNKVRDEYQHCLNELSGYNEDDILRKLEAVQDQLSDIPIASIQRQKEAALVLAGTYDTSIREIQTMQMDSKPQTVCHVFCDEAGYTSLARAMVAFSFNSPVTFLGDHKQLPPVCEVPDQYIKDECPKLCIWALSAAFYSEFVYSSFDDFFQKCFCANGAEPSFSNVEVVQLNHSFRFGPELARILDSFIYHSGLVGAGVHPLEVEVLDAPMIPSPGKRTSMSECNAIRDYLSFHNPADVAILTPYVNQAKLLKKILPEAYRHQIMTVHRSQGQEWETVFLSVVDSHNPYFVNSSEPVGKKLLNTAVSRTKCKLIIACDRSEWVKKDKQLVTELIRLSGINSIRTS